MPEAIPVFDDPYAITVTDDESDPNERRFITLGVAQLAACWWSSTPGVAKKHADHLRAPRRTARTR